MLKVSEDAWGKIVRCPHCERAQVARQSHNLRPIDLIPEEEPSDPGPAFGISMDD